MFEKILVAYDDGILAYKALDTAIELAKNISGEIIIGSAFNMHTHDWERITTMAGVLGDCAAKDIFHEINQKYIERIQAEAVAKVLEANIRVQSAAKKGNPGSVLTQMAQDFQADLIVMGSHNRDSIGQFFLGSVSNYVLHNTACPVLIIKN
jgi:nucleotide-binding universal stress UspA family protein